MTLEELKSFLNILKSTASAQIEMIESVYKRIEIIEKNNESRAAKKSSEEQ